MVPTNVRILLRPERTNNSGAPAHLTLCDSDLKNLLFAREYARDRLEIVIKIDDVRFLGGQVISDK